MIIITYKVWNKKNTKNVANQNSRELFQIVQEELDH